MICNILSFPLDFFQVLHFLFPEEALDVFEVLGDFLVAEFVDFFCQSGEEITVVRHDDEGAVEVFQGTFQDVLGT